MSRTSRTQALNAPGHATAALCCASSASTRVYRARRGRRGTSEPNARRRRNQRKSCRQLGGPQYMIAPCASASSAQHGGRIRGGRGAPRSLSFCALRQCIFFNFVSRVHKFTKRSIERRQSERPLYFDQATVVFVECPRDSSPLSSRGPVVSCGPPQRPRGGRPTPSRTRLLADGRLR